MSSVSPAAIAGLQALLERHVRPGAADLALLLNRVREHQLGSKTVLHRPGEVCNRVYLVLDGVGRQYVTTAGQEHTTAFAGPGNLLTELDSFVKQQPGQLYLAAATPLHALSLSYHDLQALYAASPVWERCGRLLAEHHALDLARRAQALQFKPAAERYAELLATRPELFHAVPLYQIASYLGVAQETLSRLRRQPPVPPGEGEGN